MNEYDSNRIYDTVKKIGFVKSDNMEEADCYLLNTCHIRDKAKEKVYHDIGRVKKKFRSKKKPFVIVVSDKDIVHASLPSWVNFYNSFFVRINKAYAG